MRINNKVNIEDLFNLLKEIGGVEDFSQMVQDGIDNADKTTEELSKFIDSIRLEAKELFSIGIGKEKRMSSYIDTLYDKLPKEKDLAGFDIKEEYKPLYESFFQLQKENIMKVEYIYKYSEKYDSIRYVEKLVKAYNIKMYNFWKKNIEINLGDYVDKTNQLEVMDYKLFFEMVILIIMTMVHPNKLMSDNGILLDSLRVKKKSVLRDYNKERFHRDKLDRDRIKELLVFLNLEKIDKEGLTHGELLKKMLVSEMKSEDEDIVRQDFHYYIRQLMFSHVNEEQYIYEFKISNEDLSVMLSEAIKNILRVRGSKLKDAEFVRELKHRLIDAIILDCSIKHIESLDRENKKILDVKERKLQPLIEYKEQEDKAMFAVKKEIEELQKKIVGKDNRSKEEKEILYKEIGAKDREINKLQKKIEEYESLKNKYDNLIEELNRKEKTTTVQENISIEEIEKYFRANDGIIFGGHVNWIRKLKEFLPNYTYITGEEIHKDLPDLRKMKHIYINTNFFNHSFYQKIQNAIGEGMKIQYVSGYGNIDRTLREMWESVEEN